MSVQFAGAFCLYCVALVLGKTHNCSCTLHLGIAQIAIGPPPALNWALWGQFEKIRKITVVVERSAPNHQGKRLNPPNNKEMYI